MKKFRLLLTLFSAFLVSAIISFSSVTTRKITKSTMIEQLKSRYQWVYIENGPGDYTQLISSTTSGYEEAATNYLNYLKGLGELKGKRIYTVYAPLYNAIKRKFGSYSIKPDKEVKEAVESRGGVKLYSFVIDKAEWMIIKSDKRRRKKPRRKKPKPENPVIIN